MKGQSGGLARLGKSISPIGESQNECWTIRLSLNTQYLVNAMTGAMAKSKSSTQCHVWYAELEVDLEGQSGELPC